MEGIQTSFKTRCVSFSSLLLVVLFSMQAFAQRNWSEPIPESERNFTPATAELEKMIEKTMREHKVLAASIALVDDQKLVWAKGFGYTDSTHRQRVNSETLYAVQSISKTFTATAFLMEASKGVFQLDETIIKYYPSFKINSRFGEDESNKITFRHLLSHRGGLNQEAPLGSNYDTVRCSFEDHIKSMGRSWLRFPVGKFYSYSNMGPDVIGYVLSKNASVSFEDYMKARIFAPLKMMHSTFNQEDAYKFGNLAKGYIESHELKRLFIADLPAGGLYSNVSDLAKFVSFQLSGCKMDNVPSVSADLQNEMFSIQFPERGQVGGYCLGLRAKPFYGGTMVHHTGGGYGYRTEQGWIPEAKIGVIVLSNDGNGSPFVTELFKEALKGMINAKYGPVPEPKATNPRTLLPIKPALMKNLAGYYKSNSNGAEVRQMDNKLLVILDSDTSTLNATPDKGFISDKGERFIFSFNKNEKASHFILLNEDNAIAYLMSGAEGEKAGPDKTSWKEMVGVYKGFNNLQAETIEIYRKNGYLYCSVSASGLSKLTEYKNGIFFTPDGESVIKSRDTLYFGNRPFTKQ